MKDIQRNFIPGDKWLYIKLYTGNKTADKVLTQAIYPIIRNLYKKERIEKWFFIRYADPDFHLRVRFLLKDTAYVGDVMQMLFKALQPYVKHNLIWNIQYDTYKRELERYGNELIEESESIFTIDSDCILSLLRKLNDIPNENYRWMIALKMMDVFLTDLSYDLPSKLEFVTQRSDAFKQEFGFTEHNAKQFNTKFREHKKTVENVLKDSITEPDFLSLYIPLRKSSKQVRAVGQEVSIKLKKQKDITLDLLVGSYIHMTLNRLFRSKNRKHELVIYDFMRRYYASEVARQKFSK